MSELEPSFPLEFVVLGTPISHQRDNPKAKAEWKALVREASYSVLPEGHFAVDRPLAVTLYYFPPEEMVGDVDNIVKLILDALSQHIYLDDSQIERVLVQKFEPGRMFQFPNPSPTLLNCMSGSKPALYVRISDNPHEGLR
jgi:crossover junction endodeoxyribonuclease RusA